jgi:uncharacterized OB-fold protein
MSVKTDRPLPAVDLDTKGFWDAAREGRLVFQYDPQKGVYQHPPRPWMKGCGFDWEWKEVPKTGTVYSFTVVHPPAHPAFGAPYPVVLVQIDEANVRIAGGIREVEPEDLAIGMRVEVRFEIAEGVGIPYFVPI